MEQRYTNTHIITIYLTKFINKNVNNHTIMRTHKQTNTHKQTVHTVYLQRLYNTFLGFMSGMEWGTAVAKCPGGID